LPNGLTLSPAGVITGTPVTANTFTFTVTAQNATGNDSKQLAIVITSNPNPNTVATPTANLQEGTYTTAQSVTLSCTTGGAEIRYTVNGATPTAGSTLYTGAITISATTTLKAIAVKNGMNNSGVFSATYTINNQGGNSIVLSTDAIATVDILSVSDPSPYTNLARQASIRTWLINASAQARDIQDFLQKSQNISFGTGKNAFNDLITKENSVRNVSGVKVNDYIANADALKEYVNGSLPKYNNTQYSILDGYLAGIYSINAKIVGGGQMNVIFESVSGIKVENGSEQAMAQWMAGAKSQAAAAMVFSLATQGISGTQAENFVRAVLQQLVDQTEFKAAVNDKMALYPNLDWERNDYMANTAETTVNVWQRTVSARGGSAWCLTLKGGAWCLTLKTPSVVRRHGTLAMVSLGGGAWCLTPKMSSVVM
jgi:hypothetical protein